MPDPTRPTTEVRLVNQVVPIQGRIHFAGNPWPQGHRVVSCTFNASIHPAVGAYASVYPNFGPGLMLEFVLTTAEYDEDDEDDQESENDPPNQDGQSDSDQPDWTSKIVWNNYHCCTIGPSQSSQVPGIRVADGSTPFAFDLPEYRFAVDMLPIDWQNFHETSAFGIYLLGHDSVANHHIHLHSRQPDGSYTLDWTGKIALTYAGHENFAHDFSAHVTGVRFDSLMLFYFDAGRAKEYFDIELDPALSAWDYIAPFVVDPDNFMFETRVDGLKRAVVFATRKAH